MYKNKLAIAAVFAVVATLSGAFALLRDSITAPSIAPVAAPAAAPAAQSSAAPVVPAPTQSHVKSRSEAIRENFRDTVSRVEAGRERVKSQYEQNWAKHNEQ